MAAGRMCAVLLTAALLVPAQSKNPQSLSTSTLLVASRDLADPNFRKTVILLVRFDAESVLGIVLNRRTEIPLSTAFEGLKAANGRTDPIYIGGPVERTTVFALRQSKDKIEGAENVFGQVYFISEKKALESSFSAPAEGFHVYAGYAGWSNEQLKKEVELGSWFVFRADAEAVFDVNPEAVWPRMIRKSEQRLAMARKGSR